MGIERYQVINDEGYHRETEYYDVIGTEYEGHLCPVYREIDGVSAVLCRLKLDNNWWIVCSKHVDEDQFTDMGPFVELEDAIFNFMLHSNPEVE